MRSRFDTSAATVNTTIEIETNDIGGNDCDNFEIQCDYLVVGAGLAGLSFIDTLLTENQAATVILVDRNPRPGGHWVHAYPFVELHQPSCMYGVNSLKLGKRRDKKGNEIIDPNDRANCEELLDYFSSVVNRFKECKRVTCYFNAEFSHHQRKALYNVYSIATNQGETSINVRCKKLVLVHTNVIVPSMRESLIPLHESISLKPPNFLQQEIKSKYKNFVVIGAGKSGTDTIMHLLKSCKVDKSQITWVISRDVWFFIREKFFDSSKGYKSFTDLFPPFLQASSVIDAFLQLEKRGITGRLLPDGPVPEVFKVPFVNNDELELLRTVKTVRMGHVQSIEEHHMVLDNGEVSITSSDTLFIDCMAYDDLYGYGSLADDFEVFEPGRVNLGPTLSVFNPSFSSAIIAYMEANIIDDDKTKNNFLYFLRGHLRDNPQMFLGQLYGDFKTTTALMESFPAFRTFYLGSRLNPLSPQHHGGSIIRHLWMDFGPQRFVNKTRKLTEKVEKQGFLDVNHYFGMEERGYSPLISAKMPKAKMQRIPHKKKHEKNMELRRSIELGQHYPPLPNSQKVQLSCWKYCNCTSDPQTMTSACYAHL